MTETSGTPDPQSRTFIRLGSFAALAGCLIFMVANVLHPRSSDISNYDAQIHTVAGSGIWVADHLAFLLGAFLMTAGLLAIGRYLSAEPRSAPWARLADACALISAAIVAVLIALDGLASKDVHQAAVQAGPNLRGAYFAAADMMEIIDASVFSIWMCTFFGLTFGLYAIATLVGRQFPAWTAWVAGIGASVALVLGVVQGVNGLSKLVTNELFVVAASTLNTWLLGMAISLIRRDRVTKTLRQTPAVALSHA